MRIRRTLDQAQRYVFLTRGMRHVHYRQRFKPRHGAVTLPTALAVSGVPVHGSHLGFHYDPEGRLRAVGASRYQDVSWIGGVALTSVDAAQSMAAWALANHAGVQVEDLGMLPDEVAARLRADTRLDLIPRGDGHSFEFVWTVPVVNAEGLGYTARIHAQSGDLLGYSDDIVPYFKDPPEGPSCTPAPLTGGTAIAYAQNTNIGQGGLRPSDPLTQASPSVTLADFYHAYDPDIRYQAAEKYGSTEIVVYSGLGPGSLSTAAPSTRCQASSSAC